MSTRTVIEINHDYLGEFGPDQLKILRRLLQSDDWRSEEGQYLLPNGIRILGQRHHSETLELTVI